ncbi:hypothetical protein AC1031_011154 [Aphanomyces cochlioides]|nr:hypothetical protein AC1031_011154 [Aphanomyces cochlioides]
MDYSFPQSTDEDANYLEQDEITLCLGLDKRSESGKRPDELDTAFENHEGDHQPVETLTAQKCATLLTRIREKIIARLASGDDTTSFNDKDYLQPDEDALDNDNDDTTSLEDSSMRKLERPEYQNVLNSRPLDFDPLTLLPPPSQDRIEILTSTPPPPLPTFAMPFMCLPMKALPKCVLPSVPHPAVKKYNHRSIYNCVRCGQMKKCHVCPFPENVRSVGTSMSVSTTPRDNVSRYYKCGRVLVCKK